MVKAIDRILAAAKDNGLIAGIHNASGAYAYEMGQRGFDLVTVSNDTRLLASAASAAVSSARGSDDSTGEVVSDSTVGY